MNRNLNMAFAMVALAGLSACKPTHESASNPVAPTSAVVHVQKIEPVEIVSSEEVVGTVRAKIHATLEAKQSGRIEKMPLSLGDTVRTGDLVARLDSAETAARLEQAQASLEQAEREWKRISTLFEQQSATRAERDTAETRLRVAKGAVAEAKASFGHAEIVAPFNGVVTKKWADVGDLAAPGKPILDIEDASNLQVELDVPEGLAAPLKLGASYEALLPSGNTEAIVREIAPSVDPVTRTRKLKLDLPNAAGVLPGQFLRVSIPLAEGKGLVVPAAAIVERGQLQMVFVAENQKARMHLVKSGRITGKGVEILSGIKAGDMVVIEGAEGLTDGQLLEVK